MFLLKYLEVKENEKEVLNIDFIGNRHCLLYTSPSPRD